MQVNSFAFLSHRFDRVLFIKGTGQILLQYASILFNFKQKNIATISTSYVNLLTFLQKETFIHTRHTLYNTKTTILLYVHLVTEGLNA